MTNDNNKKNNFLSKLLITLLLAVLIALSATASYLFLDILKIPLPQIRSNLISTIQLPKLYLVQSGSMEPAIKTGSIVITLPASIYSQGEVITFSKNGKNIVTHRIQAKLFPEGIDSPPIYKTAGDANEDFDNWDVANSDIIGKVVFSVPYIGYVADFAKKPQGFILLVIVPATIIIYEELKNLLRESKKGLRRLFSRFQGPTLQASLPAVKRGRTMSASLPKISILVPILGALLVFAGLATSYFLDKEESLGNVFSAASSYVDVAPSPSQSPTPTPSQIAQTLVINEVLPDTSCFQGNTEAQWIEVYNGFNVQVNLKDFEIQDGDGLRVDLVTSNTNVNAGSFALLAHNSAIWNGCYSDNGVVTANLGGQLNINTKFLRLFDASNNAIDTVIWASASAAPNLNPTQDQSIEREPDGLDTAPGGNDFNESDFVVRPTPQPGL